MNSEGQVEIWQVATVQAIISSFFFFLLSSRNLDVQISC